MRSSISAANTLLMLNNGKLTLNYQQIHNLLFIANGYHSAIYDEPLITGEAPVSSLHGAIWHDLHQEFKHSEMASVSDFTRMNAGAFSEESTAVLSCTLMRYGDFSSVELAQYVNLAAGTMLSDDRPQTINPANIKAYYLARLQGSVAASFGVRS